MKHDCNGNILFEYRFKGVIYTLELQKLECLKLYSLAIEGSVSETTIINGDTSYEGIYIYICAEKTPIPI